MTRDPLCPYRPAPPDEYAPFQATVPCQCELIATVRADTLDKAVAEVGSWLHEDDSEEYAHGLSTALTLLESLREKL